jgi:hypothetical protein
VASFAGSGAEAPDPMREAHAFLETEADAVESWRLRCLLDAGYPVQIAEHLAMSFEVDLHRAEAMIRDGCTPELAEAILT